MGMQGRAGFTLVEVMLTVLIIAMLTAIAIPAFVKYRRETADAVFANNLRVMRHAFQTCSIKDGGYPPDVNRGVLPAGMAAYLPDIDWSAPTPIGGLWDWDQGVFGVVAGVTVINPERSVEEMQTIDKRLDDGNLDAGRFRRLGAGRYTFVIE
jgi:prepilin-type N-terminal cleavage/methylation domain-containing protein